MKKILLFSFLIQISYSIFSQNSEYDFWGIWDCGVVNENSPIRQISSGSYYYTNREYNWVAISYGGQGLIAGNFNFPLLGIEGMFIRIERYERVADGYLIYLIGRGLRNIENGIQTKNDVRLVLKMVIINENECLFQYYSRTDADGFRLTFYVIENQIHRRFRVSE